MRTFQAVLRLKMATFIAAATLACSLPATAQQYCVSGLVTSGGGSGALNNGDPVAVSITIDPATISCGDPNSPNVCDANAATVQVASGTQVWSSAHIGTLSGGTGPSTDRNGNPVSLSTISITGFGEVLSAGSILPTSTALVGFRLTNYPTDLGIGEVDDGFPEALPFITTAELPSLTTLYGTTLSFTLQYMGPGGTAEYQISYTGQDCAGTSPPPPPPPPPALSLVATFNGGSDQTTSPTAAATIAHFPLGSNFTLWLADANTSTVPATFAIKTSSLSAGIDNSTLFPGTAIFQYSGSAPNTGWFQAVHEGVAVLVITPTDPQLAPVTVEVAIGDPDSLGSSNPEIDASLYQIAHRFGIPPQFLKAQVQQESPGFDPLAYRYEPLNHYNDYGSISRNRDFRVSNAILQRYRFSTIDDDLDGALTEGLGTNDTDHNTRLPFTPCCGGTPTIYDIVVALDDSQNWSNQGPESEANYNTLIEGAGTENFTAQTSLAASYGYLQMTYTTAITELHWPGLVTGEQNPTYLFDGPGNLANGGGSLILAATKMARKFTRKWPAVSSTPSLALENPNALTQEFYPVWQAYNGWSGYPPRVAANISRYIPTQAASVF